MRLLGWTFAILIAASALAACSPNVASESTVKGSDSSALSSASPAVADPLDGTAWRSTYTCGGARKNLEAAGLQKYERRILGRCKGVQHGYFGFSNGLVRFGPAGEQVRYQIVSDHAFVEAYERFDFRIHGDRAFFVGHIIKALYPYSPGEMRGEEAVDIAQNPIPYERVG